MYAVCSHWLDEGDVLCTLDVFFLVEGVYMYSDVCALMYVICLVSLEEAGVLHICILDAHKRNCNLSLVWLAHSRSKKCSVNDSHQCILLS